MRSDFNVEYRMAAGTGNLQACSTTGNGLPA
jgi:hypothetical protein